MNIGRGSPAVASIEQTKVLVGEGGDGAQQLPEPSAQAVNEQFQKYQLELLRNMQNTIYFPMQFPNLQASTATFGAGLTSVALPANAQPNPNMLVSYAMNPFAMFNKIMLSNNMYSQQQQQQQQQNTLLDLDQIEYPYASAFHLVFKIMLALCYLLLPLILTNYTVQFEAIFFYSLLDFWIVKNVSGRMLVGMRWWIEIDATGEEQWVFECRINHNTQSKCDSRIFWMSQSISTAVLTMMLLASVITLQGVLSCVMLLAAGQSLFNLWAYTQCNKVREKKLQMFLERIGQDQQFLKSVKLPLFEEHVVHEDDEQDEDDGKDAETDANSRSPDNAFTPHIRQN